MIPRRLLVSVTTFGVLIGWLAPVYASVIIPECCCAPRAAEGVHCAMACESPDAPRPLDTPASRTVHGFLFVALPSSVGRLSITPRPAWQLVTSADNRAPAPPERIYLLNATFRL